MHVGQAVNAKLAEWMFFGLQNLVHERVMQMKTGLQLVELHVDGAFDTTELRRIIDGDGAAHSVRTNR